MVQAQPFKNITNRKPTRQRLGRKAKKVAQEQENMDQELIQTRTRRSLFIPRRSHEDGHAAISEGDDYGSAVATQAALEEADVAAEDVNFDVLQQDEENSHEEEHAPVLEGNDDAPAVPAQAALVEAEAAAEDGKFVVLQQDEENSHKKAVKSDEEDGHDALHANDLPFLDDLLVRYGNVVRSLHGERCFLVDEHRMAKPKLERRAPRFTTTRPR